MAPDLLAFERSARENGFTIIAGVDEAGRGPLAGPVVAAAVILPVSILGYMAQLLNTTVDKVAASGK